MKIRTLFKISFGFIFKFITKFNRIYFLDLLIKDINKNEEYFYTLIERPKKFSNYKSIEIKESSKTCIILQGPILHENDFTLNTVKSYKLLFPQSKIILSTWLDEDTIKFNGYCNVIKSKKPKSSGRKNINLQIVSTLAGLEFAKSEHCEFVFKTRTDQRVYTKNLLPYLMSKLMDNSSKIFVSSFNTFENRGIAVSDMFMFSKINIIYDYWNCKLDDEIGFEIYDPVTDDFCFMPEYYLARKYFDLLGKNENDILQIFYIVDKKKLDIYWPKYSIYENRWKRYDDNSKSKEYFQNCTFLN